MEKSFSPFPLQTQSKQELDSRGNRGQRTFFLTREDLYGNIYLLWQEWQELSYQTYRIILLREVIIGK